MAVVMPVSDEGGQLAEHHSTADLDGADLGDLVVVAAAGRRLCGPPSGGLQVDDDERRVTQRYLVHVERQLPGGELRRHVVTVGRSTDIDVICRSVSLACDQTTDKECCDGATRDTGARTSRCGE
jgi:hypothetical protein